MFDFWTRMMYDSPDILFDDARLLAPCEPMHPTLDDVRDEWLDTLPWDD